MEQKQKTKSILSKEIEDITSVVKQLQWWQWVLGGLVVVLAIMYVQTAAEFLVSAENRYHTYPSGTDTNMYGRSGALAAILSLTAAWLVACIFKLQLQRWYILGLLLLTSIIGTVFYLPWWIDGLMMLVYLATILCSFRMKIFFFVPLVGLVILLASSGSMLPGDWCKYELTMYPCNYGKY